jgi:hypothetical protein
MRTYNKRFETDRSNRCAFLSGRSGAALEQEEPIMASLSSNKRLHPTALGSAAREP